MLFAETPIAVAMGSDGQDTILKIVFLFWK